MTQQKRSDANIGKKFAAGSAIFLIIYCGAGNCYYGQPICFLFLCSIQPIFARSESIVDDSLADSLFSSSYGGSTQ